MRAGERRAAARTFAVHGHHYAVVDVTDLGPGSVTPYVVRVDDAQVWPPTDSDLPPPVIATLDPARPLRLAFGSCRVSVSHDEAGHAAHGVDALRAYALHLAGRWSGDAAAERPDLLLFLGDQVYADETSDEMRAFIEQRRDPGESPGWELKDYEEYAHLYRLAWSEPANRWLLSTVPSAMIFDDHDIRDDWNTSLRWRRQMEATDWWHDRVVGGLASYWVYQHVGNLSPAERSEDPLWALVAAHDGPGEPDLSAEVDALAERADRDPSCYRWSFARDLGPQARLVVVDSRAARVLEPGRRSMLDDSETAWLQDHMRGDVDHLLVATSLPFLLAPALHHAEAIGEALAEGAWGRWPARAGEVLRRTLDLEHWAAYQRSFVVVARAVLEVAAGRRGRPPRTVTFLSGDVHHSYVAEAWPDPAEDAAGEVVSRLVQLVCSPIRNPLPAVLRRMTALASRGTTRQLHGLAGGRVPRSPLRWRLTRGPWYDNNLAVLRIEGDDLDVRWWRGAAADGSDLDEVASCRVEGRRPAGSGLRAPAS